jgi:hypothetical protein
MSHNIRRSLHLVLPFAVAVLLAAPVGAQGTLAAQLAGRLDAGTRGAVLAIADSARQAGLPGDPLFNKALEGASKRADGARILVAVRSLARELGEARAALGPSSTEDELVAGAAALHAGIPALTLGHLRSRAHSATTSLAVMSDLVARGVSADSAGGIVLALTDERVPDAALLDFQRNVERDIALGAPPAAAASLRATMLVSSVAASALAASTRAYPSSPQKRRP